MRWISPLEFPRRIASADPDAAAFILATGITDPTQVGAINVLVNSIKVAGVWPKLGALYPFVGGTANTHKYNLKDPRDLDAAFRILWTGAITHDANGITPDGTTGFGDTRINGVNNTVLNNVHVSIYCRSVGGTFDNMYEVGAFDSVTSCMHFTLRNQGVNGPTIGQLYRNNDGNAWVTKSDSSAQGFWMFSRRSDIDFEGYKNGVSFQTQVLTNTGTRPNRNLWIGAANNAGTPIFFSNRNLALVSVGASLTGAEVTAFSTAVETFQDTLGRGVV
jgi:hypothetical protein